MNDEVDDEFEYFGPSGGRRDATTVLTRYRRGWQHFSPHDWAWHDSVGGMWTPRNVPITAAHARDFAADRSAWLTYLAVFDASVERPGAEDPPRTVLRERYDPAAGVLTERFDPSIAAWVPTPSLYHASRDGAPDAVPWLGDGQEVYEVAACDAQAWLLDIGSDAAFDELGLWTAAEGHDDVEFHLVHRDVRVHDEYAGEQVERYEYLWRRRRDRWEYFSPASRRWHPAGPGRAVGRVPETVGGAVSMPAPLGGPGSVVEPVRPAVVAAWLDDWPRWFSHWAARWVPSPRDAPPDMVIRRRCDALNTGGTAEKYSPHRHRWMWTDSLRLGRDIQFEANGYRQVTARPIDWRTARQLVMDLHGPDADAGYPGPPVTMSHRYRSRHRPWW